MVRNFYGPDIHLVDRFTPVRPDAFDTKLPSTIRAVYTRPRKLTARFERVDEDDYEFHEDGTHEGEHSADKMLLPADKPSRQFWIR